MQDEIVDKIKKAQSWGASRYQIDQDLIEAGHKPSDIDATWDSIAKQNQKKRRTFSKLLHKLQKSWILLLNIGLVVLAIISLNLIPYYWLRLSSPVALFLIAIIVFPTFMIGALTLSVKTMKRVAVMTVLWSIFMIFSGCWSIAAGAWVKTEQVITSDNNYYLLVRQESDYDHFVDLEVYQCQFVDIVCWRIDNTSFIDYSCTNYTKPNQLEMRIENSKVIVNIVEGRRVI